MANFFGNSLTNTFNGSAGSDNMFGQGNNDTLRGNGGDNRLNGGTGNDTLNGGTGIDTADYSSGVFQGFGYTGATAGVTINLNTVGSQNTGGAGFDTLISIENIIGTDFADTLTGNGGNNVLLGLGGVDKLFGGGGTDRLNGGSNNDTLNGGTGSDTADYSTATAGVTVNLNLAGAQNTGGGGADTLVSIENIIGTTSTDTLTGNAGNNLLRGLAGNDHLIGNSGNDTLNGGLGDDVLDGGSGDDTVDGGDDTADYSTATAGVTVGIDTSAEGFTDGVPQNTGGAGIDTLFQINNLSGSKFNDNLWGYQLSGTLAGGDGNDFLHVTESYARLNGGAGNDQLEIAQGPGFGGESTLNGGAGADRLTDSSFDHELFITSFDYNAVSDSRASTGIDTIFGFHGEGTLHGDQIDLRDIDAIPGGANNAFTWIGSNPFTAAGQLRYAGGILKGNTDSNLSTVEFEIHLNGAPSLFVQAGNPASDILL